MRIVLESSGYVIPHNVLLFALWRYDLVPVPLTLEFKIQVNEETASLKEKDKILIGDDEIPLTIIKKLDRDPDLVQDGKFIKIASFIAFLSGCENLIEPSNKAALLSNTNFAEAYRACGVKVPFSSDIPLLNFHAFYGKTPSFEVSKRCCEEAAVILFKDKKLHAKRLSDLKKQSPILEINGRQVEWENNPYMVQNTVKNYISVGEDGSTIEESLKGAQKVSFYPGMDSRRLKNLRTVLIRKGCVMRQLSPTIVAGDVVNVDQVPFIILTAAHLYKTSQQGSIGGMTSRFWLAQVIES
ncbi:hypothetical protein [Acinetobacter colistiniresistens]|uniref:hypothetical protein n=1 Tax=Acinetobacter colistiniresistens TaxID=280145 RepID=UPI0012508D0F|nr:hypothetical protein [Acinetobacter colistiniresistens]